jgi:hypothetical protein
MIILYRMMATYTSYFMIGFGLSMIIGGLFLVLLGIKIRYLIM